MQQVASETNTKIVPLRDAGQVHLPVNSFNTFEKFLTILSVLSQKLARNFEVSRLSAHSDSLIFQMDFEAVVMSALQINGPRCERGGSVRK